MATQEERGAGFLEVDATQGPRVASMEVLGTIVNLTGDIEAAASMMDVGKRQSIELTTSRNHIGIRFVQVKTGMQTQ